jgi:hypothetical protein
MAQTTYYVVRQPGGWAVEYDDTVLCCYRTMEQAVAQARLIGRERGVPCEVKVQEPATGRFRTEACFNDQPAA